MKIALGADHRGYKMKEMMKAYLLKENYEVKDFGADSDISSDYPDYALTVSLSVAEGESEYGILICGSGMGICIAANKIKGIRAANVLNDTMAEMSRKHNDANVICLSADDSSQEEAEQFVKTFLNTEFEGGRHARRVEKIAEIEQKYL